jgi:hypothetical protein
LTSARPAIQRMHLARHAVTIIPTHDHQAALTLPA